jgi:hypothetical protein
MGLGADNAGLWEPGEKSNDRFPSWPPGRPLVDCAGGESGDEDARLPDGAAAGGMNRNDSAYHSYQTFRLSVIRHMDTWSSEFLGR